VVQGALMVTRLGLMKEETLGTFLSAWWHDLWPLKAQPSTSKAQRLS
jgi:hypothetical protein